MNNTIAIFGSARRNGNTGKFIDWISAELGCEVIDLAELNISPYDYEHRNINDDFVPLMNRLLEHNNIIFVTPVYWYAASVQMKIFIDRTSDFLDLEELKDMGRRLRQKTGFVVCTSISEEADSSFINSFKDTFAYLGMSYGGHVHANCENDYCADNYVNDVAEFVDLFHKLK